MKLSRVYVPIVTSKTKLLCFKVKKRSPMVFRQQAITKKTTNQFSINFTVGSFYKLVFLRNIDKDDGGCWSTPAGRFPVCTGSFFSSADSMTNKTRGDINPQLHWRIKQLQNLRSQSVWRIETQQSSAVCKRS